MGFASAVADRIVFMDHGQVVEEAPPSIFFQQPKNERTIQFLAKMQSRPF
jgi:ABC-type polar amino acid transport system ATPase subunit